jgi:hypothetical protein
MAVVAAATANTSASRRIARPRDAIAIVEPSASNRPERRQPSPSTSSAARKPIVAPKFASACRAPAKLITPVARSRSAPPSATAQSGAQRVRTTAAVSDRARTARDAVALTRRRADR